MIALPRALAPWSAALALFPREIALSLGGVVEKLSLLVGPRPHAAPEGGADDPDGLGGIGRRGAYERLLATDWALAEEAPDEFLRRAAAAELLFVERAHRSPAAARRCVALFDAGCDQLGAPRVVHLAALVLLAQRARDAGASFAWGVLQDEACALVEEVTAASVLALLGRRSARRPGEGDARRWRSALDAAGSAGAARRAGGAGGVATAETWLIGAPAAARAFAELASRRIEVEDGLDPLAPASVAVRVAGPFVAPREVHLVLPPTAVAVRLLRDPFQVAAAVPTRAAGAAMAPASNIVFGQDGKRLFLYGEHGALVTFPFPQSPRVVTPPKPRLFCPPGDQRLAGVGQAQGHRKTLVLTQGGGALFVHELSKRGGASVRSAAFVAPSGEPPPFSDLDTKLALLCPLADRLLLCCDPRGRLLCLAGSQVSALQERVLAIAQRAGEVVAITADDPPRRLTFVASRDGAALKTKEAPGPPGPRRGGCEGAVLGLAGLAALQTSPLEWAVTRFEDGADRRFSVREGDEVIGVDDLGGAAGPGLIVVDRTRTRIERVGAAGAETWVSADAPIAHASASGAGPQVAFTTTAGTLSVYSIAARALVLRAALEAR
ncbi:uncharacterized protein SOCE26_059030 [Sorangium cellulosum]|uniref:Uncharacterized protein n=1 Tax=Sorangium cellulosum TaxID=56 RepID=A0A2L0EYY4_SORCE|nr:hypothetical protein [Sorangium cellulosum]AUX44439.1 uncharacterized protein SOCE26_059030 [Sorangium cellulosum]